jgi:ABC-type multidrug transport system fused ATPase/permease subunit
VVKNTESVINKFHLYIRILKLTWQLRPRAVVGFLVGALIQTGATLLTIYASAQLAGLIAKYITGQPTGKIWFWLWIDVAAAVLISLSFWLMTHCKRLLYFRISSWATNEFFRALCTIDLPDFYDNEIRNQINKANNGYTWQVSNLAESCLDLLYALIRFVAISIVVAQITWWLIPLVALFLVPSLINEATLSRVQWFVWDEKGDNRHVFWKLDWLINQPFGQFELRSAQARHYIRQKIDRMNDVFYRKQEIKYKDASRSTIPAKILEAFGVAIGSVVLLKQLLSGEIIFSRYLFLSGALLRIVNELNNIFGTLSRMQ